jgi:hypothetical protein
MSLRLPTVLAAAALLCLAARAEPADDLKAGLAKCAAVADSQERLQCYDQLAAGVKPPAAETASTPPAAQPQAVSNAQPASSSQPVTSAQPPAAPAQVASTAPPAPPPSDQDKSSWFGFDLGGFFGERTAPAQQTTPQQFGSDQLSQQPAPPGKPELAELDSITATVAEVYYSPFGRFTVDLDNGQIWRQLSSDTDRAHFSSKDQVTIARGILGSYNLTIADHNAMFKVQRIK